MGSDFEDQICSSFSPSKVKEGNSILRESIDAKSDEKVLRERKRFLKNGFTTATSFGIPSKLFNPISKYRSNLREMVHRLQNDSRKF